MSPQNRDLWNFLGFILLAAWFGLLNGWQPLALLAAACAVHEGGHLLALRWFGARPMAFHLSPLGAEMTVDPIGLSYGRELIAILAGPGANILCGTILALLPLPGERSWPAAGAHFVLAAFNLLPMRPLDGGRALETLGSWIGGGAVGERACGAVGAATAAAVTVFLFWLMWASGGNLWLLPVLLSTAEYGKAELLAANP